MMLDLIPMINHLIHALKKTTFWLYLWCPTSNKGESLWHYICRGSSQPSRRILNSWGPLWVQSGQYLHCWEQVVTNGIKVDPWPQCEGLFGLVFVCLTSQSHGTQWGRCVCMGMCLWCPTSDMGECSWRYICRDFS